MGILRRREIAGIDSDMNSYQFVVCHQASSSGRRGEEREEEEEEREQEREVLFVLFGCKVFFLSVALTFDFFPLPLSFLPSSIPLFVSLSLLRNYLLNFVEFHSQITVLQQCILLCTISILFYILLSLFDAV